MHTNHSSGHKELDTRPLANGKKAKYLWPMSVHNMSYFGILFNCWSISMHLSHNWQMLLQRIQLLHTNDLIASMPTSAKELHWHSKAERRICNLPHRQDRQRQGHTYNCLRKTLETISTEETYSREHWKWLDGLELTWLTHFTWLQLAASLSLSLSLALVAEWQVSTTFKMGNRKSAHHSSRGKEQCS